MPEALLLNAGLACWLLRQPTCWQQADMAPSLWTKSWTLCPRASAWQSIWSPQNALILESIPRDAAPCALFGPRHPPAPPIWRRWLWGPSLSAPRAAAGTPGCPRLLPLVPPAAAHGSQACVPIRVSSYDDIQEECLINHEYEVCTTCCGWKSGMPAAFRLLKAQAFSGRTNGADTESRITGVFDMRREEEGAESVPKESRLVNRSQG